MKSEQSQSALRSQTSKVGHSLRFCGALFRKLKQRVLVEYGGRLRQQDEMLRKAVNEAEALAWQTPFPHLVFPVLADEKAAAIQRWAERQQTVRHETLRFAA